MPIGPTLPPLPTGKRKRGQDDEVSDISDDNVGPQLAPAAGKVETKTAEPKQARILGPSLPPSIQRDNDSRPDKDDESSDDDEFGPALPSQNGAVSVPTPVTTLSNASTATSKPTVQRDEWMTMQPGSGDWSQRVDPTKIKSRKFNTGRGATAASAGTSSWHETPEQKQARLKNEMLGIKDKSKSSQAKTSPTQVSEDDAETAERMKEYNKARGPSLMDAHSKKQKVEKDDDPSARAFDREKDIAGGLINATQRREMMKKSGNFNSRFSTAKYL